jgi:hypothetical protein
MKRPHYFLVLFFLCIVAAIIVTEQIQTPIHIHSSSDSPPKTSLVSEIEKLQAIVRALNKWYLRAAGIALVIGAIAFWLQYLSSKKAEELSEKQSALITQEKKEAEAERGAANERSAKLEVQAESFKADSEKARAAIASAQAEAARADAASKNAVAKVAVAEARSAEASAKAEEFRLDIAKANESAAKAEARALEAKLELERFKQPRTLSLEQRQRLVSKLTGNAGQKFSLTVAGDSEALDLLKVIKSILLESGWVQIAPTNFGSIMLGDAALAYGRGVIIRFGDSTNLEVRNCGGLLSEALAFEGIAGKPEIDARVSDASEINVLVGTKP